MSKSDLWGEAFGDKPQPSMNKAAAQKSAEELKFEEWRNSVDKQSDDNAVDEIVPAPRPEAPQGRHYQNHVRVNPRPAPEPVSKTRQPDSWVIDQSGQRIPMWTPDELIKPKWKSKIFLTQLVTLLFSVLSLIFGINVSPDFQHLLLDAVLALMGGSSIITIIFRFFFTDKKLS